MEALLNLPYRWNKLGRRTAQLRMYNEREEGVLMRKQKISITVIFLLKKFEVLNENRKIYFKYN